MKYKQVILTRTVIFLANRMSSSHRESRWSSSHCVICFDAFICNRNVQAVFDTALRSSTHRMARSRRKHQSFIVTIWPRCAAHGSRFTPVSEDVRGMSSVYAARVVTGAANKRGQWIDWSGTVVVRPYWPTRFGVVVCHYRIGTLSKG